MNLAFDASDLMGFLLLRLALIGGGILLLAILLVVAIVMLRRRGKLDQARRYVEPMARTWADRGGAVRKTATRTVMNYMDDDKPSR
ncbi:hypothetical protein [Actinocrispum sp. NPDC049592]|uniref:hypothetical protein n=1 Tax=Actinocrispum sp. NPDC049592 TaxID=3154835 RepID=UPI0034140FA7